MKRYNNLFEKICSFENLVLADIKARKGKKNRYGINLFDQNKIENLINLRRDLLTGNFKTSKYELFTIYEPKERLIYRLPYYPDRIVHHAIMNIMEPIWISIFTKDTYSCIKGRGIHSAAKSLKKLLKSKPEDTKYCLKIDVRKFYPSLDHNILKDVIRRKIKDYKLLSLLDEIIDSAPGVPIGNYLSQYFANLYLAYFDHWIKEVLRVKYYYRYADDIVILSSSKDNLHNILEEIMQYFYGIKLKVKKNWQIFPVDSRGINFLGYVFYHTHTLLRKSIKQRMARCIYSRKKRKSLELQYASWWGWMKYANCRNLNKKLITKIYESSINRDAIDIIKRWKW